MMVCGKNLMIYTYSACRKYLSTKHHLDKDCPFVWFLMAMDDAGYIVAMLASSRQSENM